jgi:hypothetical protein
MLAFCVFLACTRVHADEVTLKKGDVLLGRITKATESSVTLVHDVFGQSEIPKDQISRITVVHDVLGELKIPEDQITSSVTSEAERRRTEEAGATDKRQGRQHAERVTLVSGDVLLGRIIKATESSVTLVHEVFGELEVPKDQIASVVVLHDVLGEVEIPGDQIEVPPAVGLDKQEAKEAPGILQTPMEEEEKDIWFEPELDRLNTLAARLKKTGWSAAIDFSLDTTTGNTEEETTRLGAHIKRTLARERFGLDASYYYKISDGDVTDNKFTVGAVQDWLNPGSRWFFFGLGRFDYDEFESWQKRANVQVGPGYNLIGTDDMLLNLRAGAGARKEWGSENNDPKFEGLAGFDFLWKMTDRQSFDTTFHYYPVISDFDDYRTRTTLNWRYLLSKEVNVSLLVGVLHEFQSIVDPGRDDTDTRVFAGIQMSFE